MTEPDGVISYPGHTADMSDEPRVGDGRVVLRPQFTKYSAALPASD